MRFNLKNFPKDDDPKYDGLMHATWEYYSEDCQKWKEGFEAELRERNRKWPLIRIKEILGE